MRKLLTAITLLLLTAGPVYAVPVPDTGQTEDYTATWGEDSDYGPNVHSYTDLGNGIVRDEDTGREWQQATAPGEYTWQEALDYCQALSLGGHDDWRLPTAYELSTLVDSSITYPGPTIDTIYFPGTAASHYWSSTTDAKSTGNAWGVLFNYGRVSSYIKTLSGFYVRAVRSGQNDPADHFIDNGDGTVTDNSTDLMWQQATAPGTYNWEQALVYCEGLELAGYSDWRLPNRNELRSIVDYSTYDPSIDSNYFPGTAASAYWSSTTYGAPGNTVSAWFVTFTYGLEDTISKTLPGFYVRAVRSTQCADRDNDGICADGDVSGTAGDSPCTGGNTLNCDDNCPDTWNQGQQDADSDGVGDACDTIWNGNYNISGPESIAALSGYTEVTGVLSSRTAGDDGNGSLTGLEGITRVGGLQIFHHLTLTSLNGLNNLTTVTGAVQIYRGWELTSLQGLESLTSVGWYFDIVGNFELTSISALSSLTSVGGWMDIVDNPVLTSLTGLENLNSVEGAFDINANIILNNLDGLQNLSNIGGDLSITNNFDLTNLDALNQVYLAGANLRIFANTDLCIDTALALEAQLRQNGFIGTSEIYANLCEPVIVGVTTNQGSNQSSIPLDNGTCIPLDTTNIIWTSQDPGFEWTPGDWTSRYGVSHTYFSYKPTGVTTWQPEIETILYNNPGYYGQWSWVNPATVIGSDGDYDIRLTAEGPTGNRAEAIYQITIDTTGADTDEDGILDCQDNCPADCNPLQLDADLDGIGDVCDPEPNCGGCGPACEETCPAP